MRIHKISLFLSMSLLLTGLGGCREQVPPSNTPAYYALHGIVNDGKTVNEITLFNERNDNHPKLRFPAGVFVSVDTRGAHDPTPVPIRMGYANSADVNLDFVNDSKLQPRSSDHSSPFINITFHASLDSGRGEWKEKRFHELSKLLNHATDKPEWRLREYVEFVPNSMSNVSGYIYIPMDETFRQIDGTRMWIGCQGGGIIQAHKVYGCSSFFYYLNGLSVTYHYEPQLLPHWKEIYQAVLKFTDFALVK